MAYGRKSASVEATPMHVRKGDVVQVIAGAEKGKKGKVLRVFPKTGRVIVEGVHFVKRHQRPSQRQQKGGIIEKEGPMHATNLILVCGKCGRPSRAAHRALESGGSARVCRHCEEVLD